MNLLNLITDMAPWYAKKFKKNQFKRQKITKSFGLKPFQGERECARRRRQMATGMLKECNRGRC